MTQRAKWRQQLQPTLVGFLSLVGFASWGWRRRRRRQLQLAQMASGRTEPAAAVSVGGLVGLFGGILQQRSARGAGVGAAGQGPAHTAGRWGRTAAAPVTGAEGPGWFYGDGFMLQAGRQLLLVQTWGGPASTAVMPVMAWVDVPGVVVLSQPIQLCLEIFPLHILVRIGNDVTSALLPAVQDLFVRSQTCILVVQLWNIWHAVWSCFCLFHTWEQGHVSCCLRCWVLQIVDGNQAYATAAVGCCCCAEF